MRPDPTPAGKGSTLHWQIRAFHGLLVGVLAGPLLADVAWAIDWRKLVMPGPVIAGHADVEGDCGRCHETFRAEAQDRLCLDCHEAIREDVKADLGFHGRAPAVAGAQCRNCHTEHKGRDADVIALNRDAFDHRQTDFALRGAHTRVACESCHEAGKPFRDATGDCAGCHRDDDVHKGRLGAACADCHEVTAWKDAKFDHDATRYPLEGRHAQVDCALCHPNQRYDRTPTACAACHGLDDAHRGQLGRDCRQCHTPAGWKRTSFDHSAARTGFGLTGAHRGLGCHSCHEGDPQRDALPVDCVGCHRHDDDHRGRNGARCGDCHGSASWKPARFDHDRRTKFPLRGAHRDASCDACHKGTLGKERMSKSCYSCHRNDDPHAGQEGKDCGACHDERAWEGEVSFDHELTRFPLLGLHALASCEECHQSSRFRDTDAQCAECHLENDHHEARLGSDCGRCHAPNDWRIWKFEHDTETSFALHGSHDGLDCEACHTKAVRGAIRQSRRCDTCHAQDDAHAGRFGRSCDRCHLESSWQEVGRMR